MGSEIKTEGVYMTKDRFERIRESVKKTMNTRATTLVESIEEQKSFVEFTDVSELLDNGNK